MKRPSITPKEAEWYISNYSNMIGNSFSALVELGRISNAEAIRYYENSKSDMRKLLPVYVLAIRGYYLNSQGEPDENDRGIYDDAMILIGPNFFKTFNANTDPRKYENGIAMLLPGYHEFKKGFHGYSKPGGHEAFRSANSGEISPVLRDGIFGVQSGHTINLHSGGFINTNSAGCQTVIKSQWAEFKTNAYKLMGMEGQDILPYILVEEKYK